MAATRRNLRSAYRAMQRNPGFHDAHVGPAKCKGPTKEGMALARRLLREWRISGNADDKGPKNG